MVRRALRQAAVAASFCVYVAVPVARPQQAEPGSGAVVVQPGAPGKPSRTLPPDAKAVPPQLSTADVAFMQGMIMHHAQAVEMTAMIPLHTQNKDVRLLGAKISSSQADEMGFMRRWLGARGEPTAMPGTATHGTAEMPDMPGMQMAGQPMMMPGMLSAKQMAALRQAGGPSSTGCFWRGWCSTTMVRW